MLVAPHLDEMPQRACVAGHEDLGFRRVGQDRRAAWRAILRRRVLSSMSLYLAIESFDEDAVGLMRLFDRFEPGRVQLRIVRDAIGLDEVAVDSST